MPRSPLLVLTTAALLAAALCAPPAARAGEPAAAPARPDAAPAETSDPGDPRGVTRFTPTRRDGGSSARSEVRARLSAHRTALATLRSELASAAPEQRPAIQRRIEAQKLDFEMQVTSAQLATARRAGRADDIERLGRRLARLAPAMERLGVAPTGGAR